MWFIQFIRIDGELQYKVRAIDSDIGYYERLEK
jgi:hypothetical protein